MVWDGLAELARFPGIRRIARILIEFAEMSLIRPDKYNGAKCPFGFY